MEGPLGSPEAMGPKLRLVENSLDSPEVEVLNSSSEVVTVEHLEEVRKCYNIPREYVLHIPLPGQHPYDAFSDGFGLSIDALEHRTSVPTSPHDRGLPQGMTDLTIANDTQLVALHGGIPRGMSRGGHCPDLRLVYDLLSHMLGAGRLLLDHPKRVSGERGSLQQQRLESPIFVYFLWSRMGFPTRVDCSDHEQCPPIFRTRSLNWSKD
ncbi:hypothetical protein BHE74_00007246 [Ensete ventricosum]|nr:hypothetical protein BHE74_00007246 [Ensete ventricosum]